ncbi:MAG: thioesterase family protein [Streptosporangiales bacterium]|nr:thioesterase family protein [Streptosporangiales bacterium]
MDSGTAVEDADGGLRLAAGLFTVEAAGTDTFRAEGAPGGEKAHLFGGQIAAQALGAAWQTVTGARPHSLHCYFLRPGDVGQPTEFTVERPHEGRTFSRRRVMVFQRGVAIASLDASFTADSEFTADAASPADCQPAPRVPSPDDCPEFSPPSTFLGRRSPWKLIEVRLVPSDGGVPDVHPTTSDLWIRFRGERPPGIRPEVIVTYLSDLAFGGAMMRPSPSHPEGRRDVAHFSSLDHCAWFHHAADLSDWLLFTKSPVAAGHVRGLVTGQIFNHDGGLVASLTQEALLHLRRA